MDITDTITMTVLVTGASGKTGRRVAERLQRRGHAVRLGSRSTTPPLDWDDTSTSDAALEGVDAAYLDYAPDVGYPGAARTLGAFAEAAASQGVRHLVLLSGRGEEQAAISEQEVRRAGVPTTVVRCSWFAQNFSEHFLLGPVLDGTIVLPDDGVPEPFVRVFLCIGVPAADQSLRKHSDGWSGPAHTSGEDGCRSG